ncbi:hypothetical protein BpHYR1_013812 [Brachionus plicatilis]|uniref:HAT C-terminal dimerisation domain-containing protein n=1 Tax=Brachionus plicatilis TaxID=10195 RepID=A0A3M7SWP9_BRAPC|nr:hypothetical protein BpHYR1_013812 [Brachionus plicatilis]
MFLVIFKENYANLREKVVINVILLNIPLSEIFAFRSIKIFSIGNEFINLPNFRSPYLDCNSENFSIEIKTSRTNSTNTETPTSNNQKKRKEIEPRSWKRIQFISVCELIYCVTATSVPSENLFSNAGLVQNDQRNRMEPSASNMFKISKL